MRDFRDLAVWQRSHQLTLALYRATRTFPRDELFGLTSQLRRASSSIPGNLAEGCGRDSAADFRRHVVIAHGSASETDYYLQLAAELGFLSEPVHLSLHDEVTQVKRMLGALARKLKADS